MNVGYDKNTINDQNFKIHAGSGLPVLIAAPPALLTPRVRGSLRRVSARRHPKSSVLSTPRGRP